MLKSICCVIGIFFIFIPEICSMSASSKSDINTKQSHNTNQVTILGFGSLLSESSSRVTFPNLRNFRLGRVNNYRRVFAHPASIFFERKIANLETMEMSSLSAEPCEGAGFVCSIFEVSTEGLMEVNGSELSPSDAFREREEEFNIQLVPFKELHEDGSLKDGEGMGILCVRSTDNAYLTMWGADRFNEKYKSYGLNTIWNYTRDSGLRPCGVYLRHCVLAAKRMGNTCYSSFLDETFLVDRKATIRSYLKSNPNIMDTLPPIELATRYGG